MTDSGASGGNGQAPEEAGVVTLVEGAGFCISGQNGDITAAPAQGLFFRDTRILSRWELLISGHRLQPLSVLRPDPLSATFLCRTPAPPGRADSTMLVVRRRFVGNGMREDVELRNLGPETAACVMTVLAAADFADIFEVKENRVPARGEAITTLGGSDGFHTQYRWMGQERGVRVRCDQTVQWAPGSITLHPVIEPRASWHLTVQVVPSINESEVHLAYGGDPAQDEASPVQRLRAWRQRSMSLNSPDQGLCQTLRRSEEDLGGLRIVDPGNGDRFVVAAGAPWFMTLFGRDSLMSSYLAIMLDQRFATGTLQVLAAYQGREVNPVTEEQPGRILHEIRYGLSSSSAPGSHHAYYGTVDATPLFVVLLGELDRWGSEPEVVEALLPHADRALEWMQSYGDADGDGFLEYRRMTDAGLVNQGWKDSADGVTFAGGRIADPPIALCEVQGYAYAAYLSRAHLARRQGDTAGEKLWTERAAALKVRFNEAFWMPERGYYAMALDAHKEQVDSVASNIGHCLWTGIVEEERAASVAEHLLSPEMFSGWGIRTLSTGMGAYNPMSYHNGSVWPHDNAVVTAGLMRYGFVKEAQRVAMALLESAEAFSGRLPELFCGFDRSEYPMPVRYPTSCSPQAWAAATPIHLLRTLLRCEPDLPEGKLWLAPVVPESVLPLEIRRLPLGDRHVSVRVGPDGCDVDELPAGVTHIREPPPTWRNRLLPSGSE